MAIEEKLGKWIPRDSYACSDSNHADSIAIIGLDFRFPKDADSVQGFWDLILKGESAMTEVPQDRWNVEGYYTPQPSKLGTVSHQNKNLC